MPISPRKNFWNPPPVPDTPTVTRKSGAFALNSSAMASVMGKTVLDPSISISPDGPLASPDEPQDAIKMLKRRTDQYVWFIIIYLCFILACAALSDHKVF